MDKTVSKNINKNLCGRRSQKLLDHAKKYVTDAIKTASKRAIQETAGVTGDLVGNKISYRITKISRTSKPNNLKTITNKLEIL